MAASNKITVLLDVTMSSLVDGYIRFGGSGCFHFQSRSLERVRMKPIFFLPPRRQTSSHASTPYLYSPLCNFQKPSCSRTFLFIDTQKFTACQLRFHRITCTGTVKHHPRGHHSLRKLNKQQRSKRGFGGGDAEQVIIQRVREGVFPVHTSAMWYSGVMQVSTASMQSLIYAHP